MPKSAPPGFVILCLGLWLFTGCGDDKAGIECGQGTQLSDGLCVPDSTLCGPGTAANPQTGVCESTTLCAAGTVLVGEECVPDGSVICQSGTTYNSSTGACDPDIRGCGTGTVLLVDRCVSEDEALMASQEEAPEPNDEVGLAGSFAAPMVASQTTIHGCISPIDSDGDGSIDIDVDSYRLSVSGPTLLDISVDGLGGLAGAFQVRAQDGELAAANWERIGLNLVGDTSRRQVFFPVAGDYFFNVTDGRSLLQNAPAGSSTSCYFASLRGLAMPAASPLLTSATGLLSGNAVFLAYTPQANGDFIRDTLSATSASAAPAIVHMREGQLASSAIGGATVNGLASGLHSNANLILVIESHFNYSLDPVAYDLSLTRTAVPAIVNGGVSTISVGTFPDQELTWFEAAAGEIVRVALDDADLSLSSVHNDLSGIRSPLCGACASRDFYYQAKTSGIVYLHVESASAIGSFPAAISLQRETPAPLIVGTPLVAQNLSVDGLDFLSLSEANPSWSVLTATPSGFSGNLEVRRYPRSASGFLDADVIAKESLAFSGGQSVGRIIDSASGPVRELLAITDLAFDNSADTEVYDLSVSNRVLQSLLVGATPVTLSALAIDATATHHYLIAAGPGQRLEIAATNLSAVDLSIELLDNDENTVVASNVAGPGGDETLAFYMPPNIDMPLALRNLDAAGSYDLTVKLIAPTHTLNGPGGSSALPGAGIVSETAMQSTACVIESLSLGIAITGSNIGDMAVSLESPEGSSIALHNSTGGTSDNLIGSYPGTLSPAQSLDALAGQEAQGEWRLHVQTSSFAKTIDSWQLQLFCAP